MPNFTAYENELVRHNRSCTTADSAFIALQITAMQRTLPRRTRIYYAGATTHSLLTQFIQLAGSPEAANISTQLRKKYKRFCGQLARDFFEAYKHHLLHRKLYAQVKYRRDEFKVLQQLHDIHKQQQQLEDVHSRLCWLKKEYDYTIKINQRLQALFDALKQTAEIEAQRVLEKMDNAAHFSGVSLRERRQYARSIPKSHWSPDSLCSSRTRTNAIELLPRSHPMHMIAEKFNQYIQTRATNLKAFKNNWGIFCARSHRRDYKLEAAQALFDKAIEFSRHTELDLTQALIELNTLAANYPSTENGVLQDKLNEFRAALFRDHYRHYLDAHSRETYPMAAHVRI